MIIKMLKKIIKIIYCLPKSIYFNFYYLPFRQAIKFPIWVHGSVKIENMGDHRSIEIYSLKSGAIRLGLSSGSFAIYNKNCWWNISNGAKVIFKEKATLSRGFNLEVSKDAYVEYGKNFSCNVNVVITSAKKIIFGDNCLIGWGVTFMDGDGHKILENSTGIKINRPKEIKIGQGVWIGACVSILKGVEIKDNSIIAYGSIVTKKVGEDRCIILNNSIIKRNVEWEI